MRRRPRCAGMLRQPGKLTELRRLRSAGGEAMRYRLPRQRRLGQGMLMRRRETGVLRMRLPARMARVRSRWISVRPGQDGRRTGRKPSRSSPTGAGSFLPMSKGLPRNARTCVRSRACPPVRHGRMSRICLSNWSRIGPEHLRAGRTLSRRLMMHERITVAAGRLLGGRAQLGAATRLATAQARARPSAGLSRFAPCRCPFQAFAIRLDAQRQADRRERHGDGTDDGQ